MDAARGGMLEPHTCMLPFLNLTLIVVVFCRCWNNADASSLLYEPPYTEPYVRWCGRTAEVTPPPTRLADPPTKTISPSECELFLHAQRRSPFPPSSPLRVAAAQPSCRAIRSRARATNLWCDRGAHPLRAPLPRAPLSA